MRGDGDATVVLGISLAKSSPALWLLNKAENVNGGPKIVGLKLPHKNDNLESTWTSQVLLMFMYKSRHSPVMIQWDNKENNFVAAASW